MNPDDPYFADEFSRGPGDPDSHENPAQRQVHAVIRKTGENIYLKAGSVADIVESFNIVVDTLDAYKSLKVKLMELNMSETGKELRKQRS
jgi:hypothetical protein